MTDPSLLLSSNVAGVSEITVDTPLRADLVSSEQVDLGQYYAPLLTDVGSRPVG